MAKQFLALFLFSFILLGGCLASQGTNTAQPTAAPVNNSLKLNVVASFYPIYFFASEIAGDKAKVVNLVPPGVEPHDFELTPVSAKTVQSADLILYNGLGLEHWIAQAKDSLRSKAKLVDVSTGIPPLSASGNPELAGQFTYDPHIWLDPVNAKAEVANILAGLKQVDPSNSDYYDARAKALDAKLDELDGEYRAGLASCKRKDVITSHAAFAYISKRYGLNQVPISGLSPDSEPSPSDLAKLIDFAKKNDVKYVFFESLVSPALSKTIADAIGGQTMVLDPIEGVSQENLNKGVNYLSLMKQNLVNLRIALECS